MLANPTGTIDSYLMDAHKLTDDEFEEEILLLHLKLHKYDTTSALCNLKKSFKEGEEDNENYNIIK